MQAELPSNVDLVIISRTVELRKWLPNPSNRELLENSFNPILSAIAPYVRGQWITLYSGYVVAQSTQPL